MYLCVLRWKGRKSPTSYFFMPWGSCLVLCFFFKTSIYKQTYDKTFFPKCLGYWLILLVAWKVVEELVSAVGISHCFLSSMRMRISWRCLLKFLILWLHTQRFWFMKFEMSPETYTLNVHLSCYYFKSSVNKHLEIQF